MPFSNAPIFIRESAGFLFFRLSYQGFTHLPDHLHRPARDTERQTQDVDATSGRSIRAHALGKRFPLAACAAPVFLEQVDPSAHYAVQDRQTLPNIPKNSSFRVPTPYNFQGSAFSSFLNAHLNGLGTCTDSSLTAPSRTHDNSDGELVPTHPSRLSSLFPASNVNCL